MGNLQLASDLLDACVHNPSSRKKNNPRETKPRGGDEEQRTSTDPGSGARGPVNRHPCGLCCCVCSALWPQGDTGFPRAAPPGPLKVIPSPGRHDPRPAALTAWEPGWQCWHPAPHTLVPQALAPHFQDSCCSWLH